MKVGDVQTFEKHHELKGAIVSIHNRVRKNRADILELIKNITWCGKCEIYIIVFVEIL